MDTRQLIDMSARQFEVYALALPTGPNFGDFTPFAGWRTQGCEAAGLAMMNHETGMCRALVLRRQVDHRWAVALDRQDVPDHQTAVFLVGSELERDTPPLPLPPQARRRPPLLQAGRSTPGKNFKLLTTTLSHYPALMTVGEAYLALPKPDANFVPDFQGANFDARLFELYLLAAFREQEVSVSQTVVSPDFHLAREGHEAWVEAVTAHAPELSPQGPTRPVAAPENKRERLLGAPAVRFAKTLRSKLQRNYEILPHVQGKPFALALADFHAPSSLVWSREALPSYLYGAFAHVETIGGRRVGVSTTVSTLEGPDAIPAGLFRDPAFAHLSAIIFSNAATFSKFNRMGLLAGWAPKGLRMVRKGILYDRTAGALEPIDFELDVQSPEYAALWPWGEQWCQELEVFHNPLADHPIAFDLLPGATHWFERDGEIGCDSIWANSVLSSMTTVLVEE
ncbi:hypothetical protein [Caulobacter sp. FWC2]|uniref:hypothetical protein n=1 Tax=Caulobacter sp. FWC2 TaxID=69664 RepID=UPI0018EC3D11|nr:hypothetical protein [Caulobacter sp. FWC2]